MRMINESSPINPHADASLPLEFAEDTLALEFTETHAEELRFTAAWGRWSAWDGVRWKRDVTYSVFDLVRHVCRQATARCGDPRIAIRIASAAYIAAVERLARTDRRHAALVDQWDADPWILNTPGGTVDLHTGQIRPNLREDYCTKATSVAPEGNCPLWNQFLATVTDRQLELQLFLQRMCGYILTGVTWEHALFFLYGTGGNGKSVFINTIAGIMGEYARTAPIETFIASATEHHPTDLAGLHGARLVTAVETEEGRRWAESKIKALTGGDKISARFMRQDYFEFMPQFKLVIGGNHKPSIGSVDEAIRRRLHLNPFTVTIPLEERDLKFAEKLRQEWSGILQWMIDGCLAWQREGLNPPPVVRDATADYLDAEDTLGRWLEECATAGKQFFTPLGELFQSWQKWCERNGERPGTPKSFSQNLEGRKFERKRSVGVRGFQGIALRVE